MIKKVIYISNPAYLKTNIEQLVVEQPGITEESNSKSLPIEDIGVLIRIISKSPLHSSHYLNY